jgi:TolA-binding protein
MKRMIIFAFAMCCLLICTTQTWTQQPKSQKSQLRQKRGVPSSKTTPSEEALTQQLKSLEEKLVQLQAKARKLETSSQQTITTLEKKVARLDIRPISRQTLSSETGNDVIGFTKQGNKYTLAVHGAKIEIDAAGNILFQTTGQLTLESAAILHAKAGIIKLGNKSDRPVAALQDVIAGNRIVATSCKNVLVE